MNMIDGSSLLTTIFVLVDDWYQQKRFGIDVLTFEQYPIS